MSLSETTDLLSVRSAVNTVIGHRLLYSSDIAQKMVPLA